VSATRFAKYILFDANNESHRAARTHKLEYDGWYFLRANIGDSACATYDAYKDQHGHYPPGVVEGGGDISDAYIPARREARTQEDLLWQAQADNLKAWADWDDAEFGDW